MSNRAFSLLYLICLVACVSSIHGIRAATEDRDSVQELDGPQPVAIALPPKPEVERPEDEAIGESTLYDEATCETYEGDFRDACYEALARQRAQRDLPGALRACEALVRERLRLECLADIAGLHALTDLEAARALCPTIPTRKWHDQCYFGIAMTLVAQDPALALSTCDDAGIWRDFCRHDVLGEVAVVDLSFVLAECAREQGDLLTRKTCWHGIGKYIGRQDIDAAFAACREVPLGPENLYRENCVHGAGWAAGERWGVAGAQRCPTAGEQRDSCVLGVAYQLKRIQPDEAVELCRTARRDDLRDHCLAFLRR